MLQASGVCCGDDVQETTVLDGTPRPGEFTPPPAVGKLQELETAVTPTDVRDVRFWISAKWLLANKLFRKTENSLWVWESGWKKIWKNCVPNILTNLCTLSNNTEKNIFNFSGRQKIWKSSTQDNYSYFPLLICKMMTSMECILVEGWYWVSRKSNFLQKCRLKFWCVVYIAKNK